MEISLTEELEQFVTRMVEEGLHRTASEVVSEGLRFLKSQDDERQQRRNARRFNTFVSDFSSFQGRLKSFRANPLNTSITVERQGSKDVIDYKGPVIAYGCVILDATGLHYNAAPELCLDTELLDIDTNDVLGFLYDVTDQGAEGYDDYEDPNQARIWRQEPHEWSEQVRSLYSGWNLEPGKTYGLSDVFIKVPKRYLNWTIRHYQQAV